MSDSSALDTGPSAADSTAGEIARWSTQVGGVTVNFAFGHVRNLHRSKPDQEMQKDADRLQKAPAVKPDKRQG